MNNYRNQKRSERRENMRDFSEMPSGMNCAKLLSTLRMLDFAIIETALYLDAYPESEEALNYYNNLIEQRVEYAEAYEAKCGPLTIMGNKSDNSWDGVSGPWPWEPEAN